MSALGCSALVYSGRQIWLASINVSTTPDIIPVSKDWSFCKSNSFTVATFLVIALDAKVKMSTNINILIFD